MRRRREEGALARQPESHEEILKPGLEGECGRKENGLCEGKVGCDGGGSSTTLLTKVAKPNTYLPATNQLDSKTSSSFQSACRYLMPILICTTRIIPLQPVAQSRHPCFLNEPTTSCLAESKVGYRGTFTTLN